MTATRDIVVSPRLTIPASELGIAFARSGGPGGQNVNKVSSKVELRWNPAASSAIADSDRVWLLERLAHKLTSEGDLIARQRRRQAKNRDDASSKLSLIVRAALDRPKARRPTKPSRSA